MMAGVAGCAPHQSGLLFFRGNALKGLDSCPQPSFPVNQYQARLAGLADQPWRDGWRHISVNRMRTAEAAGTWKGSRYCTDGSEGVVENC